MSVGKYTYGIPNVLWNVDNCKLTVGNFCSIANNVNIYLGNGHGHDISNITTYPFGFTNTNKFKNVVNNSRNTNGDVVIGNDVWIGENVTIMSGVTIGDGVVIANNSHVVKNVEPYSLVGGNPAKLIKKRFTDEQIEKLLEIKWWDWTDEKINKFTHLLCNQNIDEFIESACKKEKKDIIILDCNEIGCPQVLMFVFTELCRAFKDRNYNVRIVNNINEITNDSIVFMGDTFRIPNVVELLNSIAPNAFYIGWYWHEQNTDALKNFIYTYENMLNPDDRKLCLNGKPNQCPLLLRACERPDLIGSYKKNIIYDFCYMGWNYSPHLVPSEPWKGFYLGVYDHNQFLPYDKRKEIHLSSVFALGIQSDTNIEKQHVSQRIFEGLAYGCVVFSNSMPACEQTNNIVVYISSKEDLENKMKFFKENPELIKRKQEEGYEFIRKYGTNHYAIDKFIECMDKNFL